MSDGKVALMLDRCSDFVVVDMSLLAVSGQEFQERQEEEYRFKTVGREEIPLGVTWLF
jgi:hypothetical protein